MIESFVTGVLANRSNNQGRLILDIVTEAERQRIQTSTGINVGESTKILVPSAVIHATNQHPDLTLTDWRQMTEGLA